MSSSLTNIADLLAHAAATWPTAPALSDRTNKITYDRLDGRVNALAQGLTDLGVQPGDRVAIITDKSIDIVAAMFGCYRAGAVLVPVNPLLKAPQVTHILNDSDARLLLAAEKRLPLLESLSGQAALRAVLPAGTDQPAPLEGQGGLPAPVAAPSGFDTDELATLFYTSGSTGLPKAVACTHANILAGAESVASYLENTSDDVILAILPLSFDAGYSQLTTAFQSGAHVILQDYLLPRDISRAAEQHGVTGITGVPAIWAATVKASWSDEARNRLRYFANTGGHLQQERINQLMQLFPKASPYPMYGLTEAFRSAYLPPDRIADKPGSMGRAIPGAKLFVLDETGAECAPHQPGELVHAGPTVSLGYWKKPDQTARHFRPAPPALQEQGINEIVVYSGDIVTRDEEGFLYYRSRGDAQIKISGNRISFLEVEDTALRLAETRACVAGGRANPEGGDPALILFAEGDNSDGLLAEKLNAKLRQDLPGYTVPSEIIIRDRLLMNANGKYDFKAMLAAHDGAIRKAS